MILSVGIISFWQKQVPNMYTLLQVVKSNVSLPSVWKREPVCVGDIGTIVNVFDAPELAYEVEFCNESGETLAFAPLLPHQIEPFAGGGYRLVAEQVAILVLRRDEAATLGKRQDQ